MARYYWCLSEDGHVGVGVGMGMGMGMGMGGGGRSEGGMVGARVRRWIPFGKGYQIALDVLIADARRSLLLWKITSSKRPQTRKLPCLSTIYSFACWILAPIPSMLTMQGGLTSLLWSFVTMPTTLLSELLVRLLQSHRSS